MSQRRGCSVASCEGVHERMIPRGFGVPNEQHKLCGDECSGGEYTAPLFGVLDTHLRDLRNHIHLVYFYGMLETAGTENPEGFCTVSSYCHDLSY